MRVVEFTRRGGPEVLAVVERPVPRAPRGEELLVEVEASSINGTDLGLRRGLLPFQSKSRKAFVPGFDLVGRVAALGPAVTAYGVGDRVLALLDHSGGGQAERVLVPQGRTARVPDTWDAATAAALPLAGLTALQALYGRAGLTQRPDAEVLVLGASGGIGTYAVQLARLAGALVTGTASREKHERLTELGVAEVLDHHATDVLAGPARFDVVLDTHGGADARRAEGLLRPGGVVITTRVISPGALLGSLKGRVRRTAGLPTGTTFVATQARPGDLARLVDLVDSGRLTPAIDTVHPMTEVVEAHRRAEGGAVGKVVLTIGG